MTKISSMGQIIPASPIRKLFPYAQAAESRGIKVYRLNIGQPDIATPTIAVEAVRNVKDKMFAYTNSAGTVSYRRKLVDYYAGIGIDVDSEQMIVTNGGSEALQMAFSLCCNPGEEIIIPEPFYANYNTFALEFGVRIRPVTATIENDFALPSVEQFERMITPATRAIVICNPNNPTGRLYSRDDLQQLCDLALRYDLYIIADEVYREFCYDGAQHTSILTIKGMERNAILIDSVSKRYSMCGVRLGVLVSRNSDIIDAAMKMAQARLSPPYLAQVAGEAAADTPKSYFKAVHDEYVARRNCLVDGLNSIEGVYAPLPQGAFYTTVRLPIDDCDDFAQWMLEHFDYNGCTTMIAPASGFYATKGVGRNEARVAYVIGCDDLKAAVECLRHGLEAYNNR